MKTVNVYIDWNSIDSIEAGEKLAMKLMNKGYNLINQYGGLFYSVQIYGIVK